MNMECYEEISVIGKEVETFPVTSDFSIVSKSSYLNIVQNFPIDPMITDFCKFPITLYAEFHL